MPNEGAFLMPNEGAFIPVNKLRIEEAIGGKLLYRLPALVACIQ